MEKMKINYIDIAGTKYPMSFSLAAAKAFKNKFGSLKGMFDAMNEADDIFDQLDAIIYVLATLIMQGCEYMNLFCKNIPHEDGTCFDGERYVPMPIELIEVAVGINNMGDVSNAIIEAINGSSKNEIEVETEESSDEKNVEVPAVEIITSGSTVGEEN